MPGRRLRNPKPVIEAIEIYFLQYGTITGGPDHDEEIEFEMFLRGDAKWERIWGRHREKIVEAWIRERPGTRPWAWWAFDSPGNRKRVGGRGQMTCEKWPAVLPTFSRGLPSSWVKIDGDDPPQFESEASFLEGHGLLTDQERKALKRKPLAWKPEKVKIELENLED